MDLTINNKNKNQAAIALVTIGIFLMFIGFLMNRVISNIGFVLIGIYTLIYLKKIHWLFKDMWMATFILLALTALVSDIICEGFSFYSQRGIMKCLLILFPAFVFTFQAEKKQITLIHYSFIFLMFASSLYSIYYYTLNYTEINSQYKMSKVMSVLAYQDHIRISWAIVISCLLAAYQICSQSSRIKNILLIGYIIFQVIFLHFLGSKTGLISLYLTAIIFFFYALPRRKKWFLGLIIPIIIFLPFLAYKTIPSLQQRINFIKYDYEHYSKGEYREGLSDAVRYYSLKAGKDIISQHPILGVGFSNLQSETVLWYNKYLPQLPVSSHFIPSSQIVIYWASAGILGLLVILSHFTIPFFIGYLRKNKWFMCFFIPSTVNFTYETHLEGQLPLFVYGFFVAWFWWLAWQESQTKNKIF